MTMGFSTSDDAANAPAERMTGSQAIVRTLEDLGVTDVFGLPGGAILPTYDPLYDSKKVRHILVRHEQAAGHAAQGYAVSSGKTGVCIATSGPGATNLLTAIADANMDSIPLVAITGQVPTRLLGSDAFQEADIVGMAMPISKHSFMITDAQDIPRALAAAFHIASTGRPGPVLVDVTKDAQVGMMEYRGIPEDLELLVTLPQPAATPSRFAKPLSSLPSLSVPSSTLAVAWCAQAHPRSCTSLLSSLALLLLPP